MQELQVPRLPFRYLCHALLAALLGGCAASSERLHEEPVTHLEGKGLAVYAAGDIADCRQHTPENSGAMRTAQLLTDALARDPQALVLTLGDNVYPDGRLQEFLYCYEPTWGQFKARTWPSPGNHDYRTPDATGYFRYFGSNAGSAGRGYYSRVAGNWLLVSLNSNLPPARHQAQLAWLETELKQHDKPCTLAFWHHPVFSSGRHGNDGRMRDAWKILAAAGAELILAAHDHHYERFDPQDEDGGSASDHGIRQFVVGTGGSYLRPFRIRSANSAVSTSSTHGVLKLELKDAGYEWKFLPAIPGRFTDRGMAYCH